MTLRININVKIEEGYQIMLTLLVGVSLDTDMITHLYKLVNNLRTRNIKVMEVIITRQEK